MTLTELLQALREDILHDRSSQIAGPSDLLWSDATLIRYIDEAHKRFARRALVIRDGTTSAVTEVVLETEESQYTLHKSIIAVISARLDGDTADLKRAGHSVLNTYQQPDNYFFDLSTITSQHPGKPLIFTTDEYLSFNADKSSGIVSMKVYPAPSATYNDTLVNLRVIRMPINDLTSADMDAIPEIPEEHHLEMLDWAAYLALRIVDVDAGWTARAKDFADTFEAHVKQAKNEAMRKLFVPLSWGFGRNGFGWEK